MKAVRVHKYGSSEALSYEDMEVPEPRENEVLVKIEAAGVNFIDVYHRNWLYPVRLPFTMGKEGAGIVDKVGAKASNVKKGQKVACASCIGTYAEYAIFPANMLVPVPQKIGLKTAAAVMMQGMTAHYLSNSTYDVSKGNTVLVHAAAGGVGSLLTQMAKMKNAKVIGTASTEEKAELARQNGADEVIIYTNADFEQEIKKITDGKGVDAVYDGVGKTTFEKSLSCLKPRGIMVSFGQSSGPIPKFDVRVLNEKGSLFLTRPSLYYYTAERKELLKRASDVFRFIEAGKLKIHIHKEFPLSEAKEAHNELESRRSSGKILLMPQL